MVISIVSGTFSTTKASSLYINVTGTFSIFSASLLTKLITLLSISKKQIIEILRII